MASGKTILAPFVTIGFPDVDTSIEVVDAILEAGADLVELGVPFSDPLAEGPTIQAASFRALQQGVNMALCLDVFRRLRKRNAEAALVWMGYYNPILRYGLERFVRDAAAAGTDGLIVPDLPGEEAGPLQELCRGSGLHLIPLLAPTSTDERIAQACKHAEGFIYCVSITGVTGARAEFRSGVARLVRRIRRHTDLPVLVGFGVSKAQHVQEIGLFADGVIVGSALLDAIDRASREKAVQAAVDFLGALKTSDA